MKQGKGIWKHGPYVAAAFGFREAVNEFLYICNCTSTAAQGHELRLKFKLQNKHSFETQEIQVLQSSRSML